MAQGGGSLRSDEAPLRRSGGDAGENLIAEAFACPLTEGILPTVLRTVPSTTTVTPAFRNIISPLDKIFGGIPAGS